MNNRKIKQVKNILNDSKVLPSFIVLQFRRHGSGNVQPLKGAIIVGGNFQKKQSYSNFNQEALVTLSRDTVLQCARNYERRPRQKLTSCAVKLNSNSTRQRHGVHRGPPPACST